MYVVHKVEERVSGRTIYEIQRIYKRLWSAVKRERREWERESEDKIAINLFLFVFCVNEKKNSAPNS